ncbi:MAG: 3-methyl-2-oxobutanoate hydroxymethyltransferase [Candidatus Caenarcaniphilales bacterium]|nr:3-methyl-2-oxobutanoate hydroxymethyltransferase [Candidatus Caenarcaniphilales bacterium]
MSKITVLTAYDFNTARALAEAGIDYILVGDSLAMVAFGYADTKKINLGQMLACTRAVHRGAPNTKIITDLPLSEVIKNKEEVLKAAQQTIKAGANIVKIEGATKETLEQIKLLRENNIEVMGHIGYTPQSFDKPTVVREAEKLINEAKTLEEYGVMGIVLEMIPSEISKKITETIKIPTIGIGAGADCTGQVLVSDDMLGRYNLINPKFLKRYANQYEDSVRAFKEYIEDVRLGSFPSDNNSY